MALRGTGLPIPQNAPVLTQPAPAVEVGSTAREWQQIAQQGLKLAETGFNVVEQEQRQARLGYLADKEVEAARRRTELRDKHANDPAGFDAAWQGYQDGVLGSAEPWAIPHLKKNLGSEGNAAYSAILGERRARDRDLDGQRVKSLASLGSSDVIGAAMAGTFAQDGPAKLAKYKAVLDSAVTSGLMAPEEAERQLLDTTNRANAEILIRDIGETYKGNRANGEDAGPAALKAAEDQILRGNLNLTEEQRYAYYHKATAQVRALEAERKQDLALAKQGMQDAMFALSKGVRPDAESIDSITRQLNAAGGQADSAKLRAAVSRAEQLESFNKLPLSEQTRQISFMSASQAAATPQAKTAYEFFVGKGYSPAAAAAIAGHGLQESKLDPGAINRGDGRDGSDSIGAFQWNAERAAALRQFAQARGKSATDFQTQLEFVDHELRTSEGRAGEALRAAKTPTEAAAAFMHFERPAGYTPDNPTAGHGFRNRAAYAEAIAAQYGDGRATPMPGVDLRLFAGQQSAMSDRAKAEWDKVSKDLDQGIRPPAATLDAIINGAAMSNNHILLESISERLKRFEGTADVARRPLGEQQQVLSELERQGAAGGLNPGAAAWMKDIEARNAEITKGLDADPVATTVSNFPERFGAPKPLDFSTSDALRGGLQQRGQIVQFASQNWGVPARSALDSADVQSVQAFMETASPKDKARLFSDLTASLPETVRNATLAKLGAKGGVAMVDAFAGGLYSRAPDISESIMRGQAAMQADKRFDPLRDDKTTFNEVLDKAMPVATFGLSSRTDPTGAYATMKNAVRARYADLAAQTGNTSAEVSEPLLERAVTDVTGGVLRHNGGTLIAPQRGMTQSQFDAKMAGVTDADLAGVTTLSGAPVTATYLRNNAKLESYGDGRYLIRLGDDAERPIYAFQDLGVQGGGRMRPFILDLRNIKPDPEAVRPGRGVEFRPYPRG